MMTTLRSARAAMSGSEVTLDQLGDVFLAAQTDDRLGELAFLEEQQRGNTADGIPLRDRGVLVHVQLPNRRTSVELRRERVYGRTQPTTRTTPLRPEVHEHDAALLLIIEVAVSERLDLFGCHSLSPASIPKPPRLVLRGCGRQRTAVPTRPTKNPDASHPFGCVARGAGCQTQPTLVESHQGAPAGCTRRIETRCPGTFPDPHRA